MTHASLKYAQLLTQGEIFQGDLFMPTKYQRDGPKNDQDCVQHSGPKCVGFVDENQPPTRQVDFGEAQISRSSPHPVIGFNGWAAQILQILLQLLEAGLQIVLELL